MSETILEVKNLKKYFSAANNGILKAVDNVTLDIYKGETLGLVGESGCGKSTLGRTIINLYKPTEGSVLFKDADVHHAKPAEAKVISRKMQMIFQDPYASLNQRMKVTDIIAEGIDAHKLCKNKIERQQLVNSLLETVGLQAEHANRFPHEFSGGQRQRIGIARALAVNPEFIIADEPISALDVSIQAQVINLMKKLQRERSLTYLFIAHDLSMVRHISDRIGVMYLGSMVELSTSQELFAKPLHPYTQALLSAVPIPDPKLERSRERIILHGSIPSPVNVPEGCRFCTRCSMALPCCSQSTPAFRQVEKDHWVACHLFNKDQ